MRGCGEVTEPCAPALSSGAMEAAGVEAFDD
jgi:hypothetical protein